MKPPDVQAIKLLDPNALFTVAEAARLLGMSYEGMRKLVIRRNCVSIKRGSVNFIKGSVIQSLIVVPVEL